MRKFYKVEKSLIFMVFTKKRGLSPVIATVLLIALAVILAMIIFLWARGWINEQIEKKGVPIDQVCESVKINIDYSTPEGTSKGDGVVLRVVNVGSVPIHAIEVRQEGGGSSKPNSFNVSVAPTKTSEEVIVILGENIKKVVVYPQLMGTIKGKTDNRVTTCLNSGKTITL